MTNQKRKKVRNKALTVVNPAATALAYRGPARMPKAAQSDEMITVQLQIINQVTSTAGGTLNNVYDCVTQAQAATDWASIAACYNEFRVLSMQVEFIPWNKYNAPTSSTPYLLTPIYSMIDRTSATAVASSAIAAGYGSLKAHEPSTKFMRTVKMDDNEEAQWTDVTSTPAATSRYYIKLWATGMVTSAITHDALNRLMVQFRGRK